jgi:hypothetical protein
MNKLLRALSVLAVLSFGFSAVMVTLPHQTFACGGKNGGC